MHRSWTLAAWCGWALAACGGCGNGAPDPCAEDEALCEGAPEILQVFVRERVEGQTPAPWRLAFGEHPAAAPDDDGSVIDALVKQARIEVIVDQPLDRAVLVSGDGLTEGMAQVLCQGLEMNVDFSSSTYRPEVSQTAASTADLPAALGPAIAIQIDDALRTDSECELRFPGVVDDEGLAIFNVSEPFFHTESLHLLDASPTPDAVDVPVDVDIRLRFNAPIADSYTNYVELLDGSDNVAAGTARVEDDPFAVEIVSPAGGLAYATTYRVVMRPGMQDAHGGVLGEEASFTFTTSPVTGD